MTGEESGCVDAALWEVGSHEDGGACLDFDIAFAAVTSAERLVRDGRVRVDIVA